MQFILDIILGFATITFVLYVGICLIGLIVNLLGDK